MASGLRQIDSSLSNELVCKDTNTTTLDAQANVCRFFRNGQDNCCTPVALTLHVKDKCRSGISFSPRSATKLR